MSENHIHRIMRERDEAREQLRQVRDQLTELERYLTSSKFHGADNDFVYVSTDIAPKIRDARFATI